MSGGVSFPDLQAHRSHPDWRSWPTTGHSSAEAVGLETLVTSSFIWAPPSIPAAAWWSSRDGGAALIVPKDLEMPLTTPPDDSLREVSL